MGVAMGAGVEVAVEGAGRRALAKGDLTGVVRARRRAAAAMREIRRTLAFAFVCNAGGAPLAAGLRSPPSCPRPRSWPPPRRPVPGLHRRERAAAAPLAERRPAARACRVEPKRRRTVAARRLSRPRRRRSPGQ